MMIPTDVVVVSDIGAVAGAIFAIPQIILGLRKPQSLESMSWMSLVIHAASLVSFCYVDARLTLWLPALQTAGSLGAVVVLMVLKCRAQRCVQLVAQSQPQSIAA
jgi:hypothetical protein